MSSYCTPADLLSLSLPATALGTISTSDQQAALDSASNYADGYLASSLTLPLIPVGGVYQGDLKQAVCDIAAYRIMKRRGFMSSGSDDELVRGYKDAIAWLTAVGAGKINPPGLMDSSGNSQDASGGPMVSTEALRGWQNSPPNSNGSPDPGDFVDSWD